MAIELWDRMTKLFAKNGGTQALAKVPGKPDEELARNVMSVFSRWATPARSFNPDDDLIGLKGMEIYEKMRRDDQVKAALSFKKSACLSTGWEIHPASDKKSDVEAADFVKWTLGHFEPLYGGFDDILFELLSALDFGFAIGELVLQKLDAKPYAGKIGLRTIKVRKPHEFIFDVDEFDNLKTDGLRQSWTVGKGMPIDKFLIFSYQREFGNFRGVSDLRSAYQGWWLKDNLWKWAGVYAERFAIPITTASYPAGNYGEGHPMRALIAAIHDAISNLQANTALTFPADFEIKLHEASGTGVNVLKFLFDHCNLAITRSILMPAQIGFSAETGVGSYAKSKTQFDAFMLIVDDLRRDLADDVINGQLIPRLVGWNYAGLEEMPKFDWLPFTDADENNLLNTWMLATQYGLVTPTPHDEAHIRSVTKFPEREITDAEEKAAQAKNEANVKKVQDEADATLNPPEAGDWGGGGNWWDEPTGGAPKAGAKPGADETGAPAPDAEAGGENAKEFAVDLEFERINAMTHDEREAYFAGTSAGVKKSWLLRERANRLNRGGRNTPKDTVLPSWAKGTGLREQEWSGTKRMFEHPDLPGHQFLASKFGDVMHTDDDGQYVGTVGIGALPAYLKGMLAAVKKHSADDVTEYAVDPEFERKHPRGGKGTARGGEFKPKPITEDDLAGTAHARYKENVVKHGKRFPPAVLSGLRVDWTDMALEGGFGFFPPNTLLIGVPSGGAVPMHAIEHELGHRAWHLLSPELQDAGVALFGKRWVVRTEITDMYRRADEAGVWQERQGGLGDRLAARKQVREQAAEAIRLAVMRKPMPVQVKSWADKALADLKARSYADNAPGEVDAELEDKLRGAPYADELPAETVGVPRTFNFAQTAQTLDDLEAEAADRLRATLAKTLDALQGVVAKKIAGNDLSLGFVKALDLKHRAEMTAAVRDFLGLTYRAGREQGGAVVPVVAEHAVDPEFERKHPRGPKGTPVGGKWIAKPGAKSAGSEFPVEALEQFADKWLRRNGATLLDENNNLEVGFSLYLDAKGKLQMSKIAQGEEAEVEIPDPPKGTRLVGSLHTHVGSQGELSDYDMDAGQKEANRLGAPYYMIVIGPDDEGGLMMSQELFEPEEPTAGVPDSATKKKRHSSNARVFFYARRTHRTPRGLAPEKALRFFDEKSLWITGVLKQRLVADAQAVLYNAIKGGTASPVVIQQLREVFDPYLGDADAIDPAKKEQVMPYRLETILRTNATEAYNEGLKDSMQEMVESGYVIAFRSSAVLDARTTEVCELLHDKCFRPNSDELEVFTPPRHFNCRSMLVAVTKDEGPVEFITVAEVGQAMELIAPGFGGKQKG